MLANTPVPAGASWSADDSIVFGRGGLEGIWLTSAQGGEPEPVLRDTSGGEAHSPQMLRGGRAALYTLRPGGVTSWDNAQIVVQTTDTAERKVLMQGGRDGRWIYFRSEMDGLGVHRKTSDGKMARSSASSRSRTSPSWITSDGGTLVFNQYDLTTLRDLWLVDVDGNGPPRPLLQNPDGQGPGSGSKRRSDKCMSREASARVKTAKRRREVLTRADGSPEWNVGATPIQRDLRSTRAAS